MFNGSRQATTLLKNAKQTEASRHALRGSYRQTCRQKTCLHVFNCEIQNLFNRARKSVFFEMLLRIWAESILNGDLKLMVQSII